MKTTKLGQLMAAKEEMEMKGREYTDHKVGIRLLDDVTLRNIFPMYDNLENKIEVCRQAAAKRLAETGKRHYQYNMMYDNVFSILGKRGTGKTSVAFTLREKIENNGKTNNDVVLPIIIPEVIPENCTILGWILAIVREQIKQRTVQSVRKYGECEKGNNWSGCKYRGDDEEEILEKKLEELNQYFFAEKYDPSSEKSYYKAVDNSAIQAENCYQFANAMMELWDLWIKILRGQNGDACPLIYVIFDDVDLAPEKIGELLSVIIKYLSHPNVIVITTADEELFLEVIENRLDKGIGRIPKEWRKYLLASGRTQGSFVWDDDVERQSQQDTVGETAWMYLGKVMPPSTRYYLRLFNTASQKENFWLKEDLRLGDGIAKEIGRLTAMGLFADGTQRTHNFMIQNGKVVNFYLNFVGNTSRQIGNVFIGIKELIDGLIKSIEKVNTGVENQERYLSDVYERCRYFLCMVVHTNVCMSANVKDVNRFVDELFLTEYRRWKLYVNYAYLNEFLEENLGEDRKNNIETGMQFYSLLSFIENILLILEKCTDKGITGRNRTNTVRPFTEYLGGVVFEGRDVFRADLETDEFFSHYMSLLNRLPEIVANKDSDKKLDVEYFYNFKYESFEEKEDGMKELYDLYNANRKWFREITGMIAKVYGNTYLIDRRVLEECVIFSDEVCLAGYQVYVERALNNNIKHSTRAFDLYEYAVRTIGAAENRTYQKRKTSYEEYRFNLNQTLRKELLDDEGISLKAENMKGSVRDEETLLYIPLANLFDRMQNEHLQIEKMFRHCPGEILKHMRELVRGGLNAGDVQKMIQGNMEKVKNWNYPVDCVHIYNVSSWLRILDEFENLNIPGISNAVRELDSMLRTTLEKSKTETSEILILRVGDVNFKRIKMIFENMAEYLEEDKASSTGWRVKDAVKESFSNMDIAVDLNDPDQFAAAVDMGMYMLFIEYLEELYLCLTIKSGYEAGSYLSSGKLQWISDKEEEKQTYYYHLFGLMKKLLNSNKSTISDSNLIFLKSMIGDITEKQRRNYIDGLIGEI